MRCETETWLLSYSIPAVSPFPKSLSVSSAGSGAGFHHSDAPVEADRALFQSLKWGARLTTGEQGGESCTVSKHLDEMQTFNMVLKRRSEHVGPFFCNNVLHSTSKSIAFIGPHFLVAMISLDPIMSNHEGIITTRTDWSDSWVKSSECLCVALQQNFQTPKTPVSKTDHTAVHVPQLYLFAAFAFPIRIVGH